MGKKWKKRELDDKAFMDLAEFTESWLQRERQDADRIISLLEIASGRVKGFEFHPHAGHEGDLYGDALNQIRELRGEIEHLRALITAWADAHDRVEDEWALGDGPELVAFYDASHALRKAVGR